MVGRMLIANRRTFTDGGGDTGTKETRPFRKPFSGCPLVGLVLHKLDLPS